MKEWLRQNGKIDIWKTEATRIRDILGNRKHRVQASILAGMLALALLGGSVPGSHTPVVMAWWGSLYPQFCFSQTDQWFFASLFQSLYSFRKLKYCVDVFTKPSGKIISDSMKLFCIVILCNHATVFRIAFQIDHEAVSASIIVLTAGHTGNRIGIVEHASVLRNDR